ncbi:hypothetical protein TNCV_1824761 [Trichonephila clavipes]|nr:hypothetical protein TNCV_1824761 [Trichonephila clavipes]
MIEKCGAIENAVIDNRFQCMDFLTAYKTFCEGPIENALPFSLDVSLGQQYLTIILKKKSICSLLNEKGLKQPQTFAEELWRNREETFNSYVSSLEANEIADCFYNNPFENEHFLFLKPVHYVTQEFFENIRLDIILREKVGERSGEKRVDLTVLSKKKKTQLSTTVENSAAAPKNSTTVLEHSAVPENSTAIPESSDVVPKKIFLPSKES